MEKMSLRLRWKTSRLWTKLQLLLMKTLNPQRRQRCPECGGHPIIWGIPRRICFCGCGHCTLHSEGCRVKDAIRNWNARKNMYKSGKKMPRVIVLRPFDGITLNTAMESLLDEDGELMVFDNEYAAKAYLLEQGCDEDDLAILRFDEYDESCT